MTAPNVRLEGRILNMDVSVICIAAIRFGTSVANGRCCRSAKTTHVTEQD